MLKGKLFVIEGPDGVGKSSTVAGVSAALRDADVDHTILSFPGREAGTLGKVVYNMHHSPRQFCITAMSPLAKQALHIAAHLDAIEMTILPMLSSGHTILLDRFWWSTWVYGTVDQIDARVLEALINAERALWGAAQPSLAILLDRDDPIDRDDKIDTWRKLRHEYLVLSERESASYPVEIVRNTGAQEHAIRVVQDLLFAHGLPRRAAGRHPPT